MGNEFGAADLQPHLVFGTILMGKLDQTGANTEELVGGGYHQKMRLRRAYWIQVDAVSGAGTPEITIKHGANSAATGTGGVDDAIGTVTEMTIVDQYKDASPEDRIVVDSDGDSTTGDILVYALYELVE